MAAPPAMGRAARTAAACIPIQGGTLLEPEEEAQECTRLMHMRVIFASRRVVRATMEGVWAELTGLAIGCSKELWGKRAMPERAWSREPAIWRFWCGPCRRKSRPQCRPPGCVATTPTLPPPRPPSETVESPALPDLEPTTSLKPAVRATTLPTDQTPPHVPSLHEPASRR